MISQRDKLLSNEVSLEGASLPRNRGHQSPLFAFSAIYSFLWTFVLLAGSSWMASISKTSQDPYALIILKEIVSCLDKDAIDGAYLDLIGNACMTYQSKKSINQKR